MSYMQLKNINSFQIGISIWYNRNEEWVIYDKQAEGIQIELIWKKTAEGAAYQLDFCSDTATQIRVEMELLEEEDLFHLIPSNIFGDNNLAAARTGEYPMLTYLHGEDVFCSPFWEFRADRASQPVSVLRCSRGAVGISIAPYTETEDSFIRNGVRAGLPNKVAVSLGYTNDPVTYVNKQEYRQSTKHTCKKGTVCGRIYGFTGNPGMAAHRIIEEEYKYTREVPDYKKTKEQAAIALLEQFVGRNWSDTLKNYTNMECHLPGQRELKPWRQLAEIGWTGGGVIGYPFMLAREVLKLPEDYFAGRLSPGEIFDSIVAGYHEESGFFNDVTRPDWNPAWKESPVNGWWTGLGLTVDRHCAYTNGSAVYYLLKTVCRCREWKEEWLDAALKVLETVMSLQKEDGNYGYTYRYDRREVADWDGFAGCWFAAAMPYAYEKTGDQRFLESAEKALGFYGKYVSELNCYGTPMDTWKSVDEEGNLAFIRAARLMHEITGEEKYLAYLEAGARYQYLWQYGFRARPEFAPLQDSGWNSCGASVTSVSNPHTHPMGSLILDDLVYLSEITGSSYHKQRAEDMFAWLMNTMELYPEVSGYGEYGVLTERYCPSDGLVIETFQNGEPSSMWFTYNGWAAANVLEAMLEKLKREGNH